MESYKVTSKADAWEVLVGVIRDRFIRESGLYINIADSLIKQIEEARGEVADPRIDRPEYEQLFVEIFDQEQYGNMPTVAGRVRVLDDLLRLIDSLERDLQNGG